MTEVHPDLRIEIRPIPNRNGIRKFSKDVEPYSKVMTITCYPDPYKYVYKTGLSQEDEDYLKSVGCPYDLSKAFIPRTPHKLWDSVDIKVHLTSTNLVLYPGRNFVDFIKWKYLLVSDFVYSSEAQMKTASKPKASHYIWNEDIEMDVKATELEKKNALYRRLSDLSLDHKRRLILLIYNEITDNKNSSYVTVKFEELFNDKAKVNELTKLLAVDNEELTLTALIKTGIHKGVLKKTKQGIFHFNENLGYREAEVVKFLSEPKNQEILLKIKAQTT